MKPIGGVKLNVPALWPKAGLRTSSNKKLRPLRWAVVATRFAHSSTINLPHSLDSSAESSSSLIFKFHVRLFLAGVCARFSVVSHVGPK